MNRGKLNIAPIYYCSTLFNNFRANEPRFCDKYMNSVCRRRESEEGRLISESSIVSRRRSASVNSGWNVEAAAPAKPAAVVVIEGGIL